MNTNNILEQDYLTYAILGVLVIATLILLKKYFNGGVFLPSSEINLQGFHAVITGGNSGIGA
jgi:hypothetical protein